MENKKKNKEVVKMKSGNIILITLGVLNITLGVYGLFEGNNLWFNWLVGGFLLAQGLFMRDYRNG